MMNHQDQYVVVRRQADKLRAQQWSTLKIKGKTRLYLDQSLYLVFTIIGRHSRSVGKGELHL
jgi:hypothetical protein